ncbi:hypothetical protein NQ317_006581 [Molorchus minor]|uniref:Uncharacterized protein n=1 Tax=Molorchus minor TaxID=1323400 RepID=A0ABQ9K3D4_9CUCU|nr:hypothetical protein NQ317_006581 [Molorchus minor]
MGNVCLAIFLCRLENFIMSRRLREEEERARQALLEQDEVDKLQVLHEQIFGPLVWRRLPSGIRIQDLKSDHYDEVLDIIENNYPQEDVVFKNSRYNEDVASQRSFRERLRFNISDNSSIIAVDEVEISYKLNRLSITPL